MRRGGEKILPAVCNGVIFLRGPHRRADAMASEVLYAQHGSVHHLLLGRYVGAPEAYVPTYSDFCVPIKPALGRLLSS